MSSKNISNTTQKNIKNKKKVIDKITVYTDGSCMKKKDGIKCGYGVYFPNKEIPNISKKFKNTPLTNQRTELYAIYKAIKKITRRFHFNLIEIYSDSKYSIDSITLWVDGWKKNNWKKSDGKDVLNQDIIKKIDKKMQKYKGKITFTHVRSHTGKTDKHSLGNEQADKLATSGALK